jgi:hypothetical protein
MDSKVIGREKYVNYKGSLEGLQPIRDMEKDEGADNKPMGIKSSKLDNQVNKQPFQDC